MMTQSQVAQQQHQTRAPTGSKMASKVKGYRVLGDVEEFQVKLAEVTTPPPPPEPDTVENTDATEFPPEVWAAASISPDKGAAIIRAFREVTKTRHQYQAQLTNIHTIRQAKLAALSNPSAGTAAAAGAKPGHLPGPQTLTSQWNGGVMPPLRPRGTLPSLAAATLKPSITESVKEGSEPRTLEKFGKVEQTWAATAVALSGATKRPVYDLAMQRGPEHRSKVEALEALERAMPIQDRIGGVDAWNMSLRDAWERIVPVGNMFSGLCAVVRDKPTDKPMENFARIGRPLDTPAMAGVGSMTSTLFSAAQNLNPIQSRHANGTAGAGPLGGTGATNKLLGTGAGIGSLNVGSGVGGIAPGAMGGMGSVFGASGAGGAGLGFGDASFGGWAGGPKAGRSLTLRGRDWQSSDWLKNQTELYAKNIRRLFPNDPELRSLAVKGQSLESQLEDLAFAPITLAEVEQYMAVTDQGAYQRYMEVKQRMEQERLDAQAKAEAEAAAAAAAAAAAGPQPGPHLTLSTSHVHLTTSSSPAARGPSPPGAPSTSPSPSTAFATFSLVHNGTAAVYFTWQRQAPSLPPFSSAASAAGAGTEPPSGFSLSRQAGVILPGETAEFTVVFSAPGPGLYSQQWVLSTQPPLPDWPPLSVTARGLCMPSEEPAEARRALEDVLVQAEKMRKVNAALERVLADVQPPPRPRPPPMTQQEEAQCGAFERGNADVVPPVFYEPGRYAELAELYAEAAGQLKAASAPPSEEPTTAKKKGAKETKGKDKEPPPPPPPAVPTFPDEWDGSLPTLRSLLEALRQLPDPAAAAVARTSTAGAGEQAGHEGTTPGPYAAVADDIAARAEVVEEAMRVPPNSHIVLRHAASRMLRQVAESVAAKMAAVQADYDQRKADQEQRVQEAAGTAGSGQAAAAAAAVGGVDERWRLDKSRAGVKSVLKTSVVSGLVEETSRALAAAGDALEGRMRVLDEGIHVLQGGKGGVVAGEELQAAQWQRFELLRAWVRLGIPSRPPYIC